jgi:transketolase
MQKSKLLAQNIRKTSIKLVYQANASHIGGALSMADILAVLYADVLKFDSENNQYPGRDRFILSKGHSCVALYATLAHSGYFSLDELDSYGKDGSKFLSHTSHYVSGVESSAGSLGHGLPIACGLAFAAKRKKETWRTYVLVGDGEMDEGSNWEALLFGAQFNLDNLCLIIDYNKIQSLGFTNEVMNLEPLKSKLEAFNWNVLNVDGHNHNELLAAFDNANQTNDKPTVIIANTIKGKGVSFMENKLLWHYKSPNEEQYIQAMEEIER